ncbi:hypothetical protein B0H14DRAFT_3707152 [Mycena olivaceomarginata]|nr:hypothetical protein B0H14DRAFT_3707152 [Mycena olivaceomarginata]
MWGEVVGIESQAQCYAGLGDFKHSIQLVEEGKALIAKWGMQGGDSDLRLTIWRGRVPTQDRAPAQKLCPNLMMQQMHSELPRTHGAFTCQVLAVDLKVRQGEKAEITRWAVILLAFTMRPCSQNMLTVHQAMWFLGNILAQQGADDEALSILTVALEGFTWRMCPVVGLSACKPWVKCISNVENFTGHLCFGWKLDHCLRDRCRHRQLRKLIASWLIWGDISKGIRNPLFKPSVLISPYSRFAVIFRAMFQYTGNLIVFLGLSNFSAAAQQSVTDLRRMAVCRAMVAKINSDLNRRYKPRRDSVGPNYTS